MGATTYFCTSSGTTPNEAFVNAVKNAKYEHGHIGYTGTIAEKDTFTMAIDKPLSESAAYTLANSLVDGKYADKWGPSGCIPLTSTNPLKSSKNSKTNKKTYFLFFGWASE
jgi:hypothetical protein